MQQLSVIYLLIPALLFVTFFVSSSSYGVFADCNRSFSCGNISNISYPFTGGDRPDYCGLSSYKLTCRQPENITLLTHKSITYRVIQLDLSLKTLTISRADFSKTICPSHFANSTFDSDLLSPPYLDDSLTLFYGCNSISNGIGINPPNLFHCSIDNSNFSDGYYLVGPVPNDPILRLVSCSLSVAVPMMRSVGVRLMADNISLGQALNEGFTVNYTDPFESICSDCARVGGYCVFDSNMGQPECNCGDRPCVMPATDPSPQGIYGALFNGTTPA